MPAFEFNKILEYNQHIYDGMHSMSQEWYILFGFVLFCGGLVRINWLLLDNGVHDTIELASWNKGIVTLLHVLDKTIYIPQ